ncbi:hypothetical protein DPMN_138757 [Dreissena polymorpha]|uniref:Uncharacterized protein n=1 Tax=Dreissena polymorpha TaxID=45954 RepID=A0A9D4JFW9_DREPO|nr:hypothetical protein DPMN_138757 [Dreissena polymorpha]
MGYGSGKVGQSMLDYANRIPMARRLYESGRSLWVYADRSLGQPCKDCADRVPVAR